MKPPQKKPVGALQRLVNALFVPGDKPKPAAQPSAGGRKADPRAELARLIRSIRAKMDPRLLKLAEKVARKGPPTTDHERAMLSVELFLAQKNDGGAFADKLRAKLEEEKRRGGPTRH
ncbi:hypothetical protein [Ferrovibrio sp.]|uniref:hypothetical protein n=1 Tax=Ferrovibrio sp. TaxID=1917215 RepID=UPI003D0D2A6B